MVYFRWFIFVSPTTTPTHPGPTGYFYLPTLLKPENYESIKKNWSKIVYFFKKIATIFCGNIF
jgi:hypothetical protein